MPHLPTCGEAAILVSPPGAATPRRPPRERGGTQLNHLPTCGEAGGDVVLGSPPHLWGGRWGRRTWDTSPLVGRLGGGVVQPIPVPGADVTTRRRAGARRRLPEGGAGPSISTP